MTNWEEIQEEYETTDITMKDLALKHEVKPSTLRSRKNREGWTRERPKKNATQRNKNVATQRNAKKSVATKRAIQELNDNDELTEKEKQFCLLYLQYFNATKAYREVYQCAYNTARTEGSKLLAKPSIKTELNRLKKEQRQELYIDSLDIKKEYMKQAFADINDFVVFGKREVPLIGAFGPVKDEDDNVIMKEVNYVDFKESVELDGTLIKEVKMGKDGPVIQLHDKQKAMQKLLEFLADTDETEEQDDGFLEALEAEAGDLWSEE